MITAMDFDWVRFALLGVAVFGFVAAALLAGLFRRIRDNASETDLHAPFNERRPQRRMTSWT